jgi:hypothetical protein
MRRTLRITLSVVTLLLLVMFVLWCPYPAGSVPQWKIRVLDKNGREAAGARVQQEWIDPIDCDVMHSEVRTANASGEVVFPERRLHSRVALGMDHPVPLSRVIVCWKGQFGDVAWDGKSAALATQLQLDEDGCAMRYTM